MEQDEFLIKEYDKLSKEIAAFLKEISAKEKFSLTIFAAVAVWIYTENKEAAKQLAVSGDQISLIHGETISRMSSLIPVLTTSLFGLSVLFLYRRINLMGSYLKKIETALLGKLSKDTLKTDTFNAEEFGWEDYLNKNIKIESEKYGLNNKSYIFLTGALFWILQLIAAIIFAFAVFCSSGERTCHCFCNFY